MFKIVTNSLVYRIAVLYQRLLKLKFRLRKKQRFLEENEAYNLLIFSGAEQLDMLNVCLSSIYKNFEKAPHIYVITDVNLTNEQCVKHTSWFPKKNLTVIAGLDCIKYHQKKGNDRLSNFASQNTMGLKMAAILLIKDLGKPLLYCDTDVIWYKDPFFNLAGLLKNPQFSLALSNDFQPSYDNTLVKLKNLYKLENSPFFCAGIIFLNRLTDRHNRILNDLIPLESYPSNHFTEQTIFAFINKLGGNVSLDPTKYIIKLSDKLNFLPENNNDCIARHYVGEVRHLFWRDAVFNK